MTAPKVILAWPWEVNPSMDQWESKPSIVGEGIRYIRADAPELLALVATAKAALALDREIGTRSTVHEMLEATLAAWEAITASKDDEK